MAFNIFAISIRTHIHAQVLTKDSVTVSVDAVVYYRVSNATVSIANVENAHHSTRLLAQTTLRNTMGTRHLHEILSERMTISGTMQVSAAAASVCVLAKNGRNANANVHRYAHARLRAIKRVLLNART